MSNGNAIGNTTDSVFSKQQRTGADTWQPGAVFSQVEGCFMSRLKIMENTCYETINPSAGRCWGDSRESGTGIPGEKASKPPAAAAGSF